MYTLCVQYVQLCTNYVLCQLISYNLFPVNQSYCIAYMFLQTTHYHATEGVFMCVCVFAWNSYESCTCINILLSTQPSPFLLFLFLCCFVKWRCWASCLFLILLDPYFFVTSFYFCFGKNIELKLQEKQKFWLQNLVTLHYHIYSIHVNFMLV